MEVVTFKSSIISIACTSDTQNDVNIIPYADIFLHSGNMTENGTLEQLQNAYDWIAALPHKVKVLVPGNNDVGLDPDHSSYSEEGHYLFTSKAAKKAGIHYLDRAVLEVASFYTIEGFIKPLYVYGNPCRPDFPKANQCFTYLPHPDPGAAKTWRSAPVGLDSVEVDIWLLNSPPKDHLDLTCQTSPIGCEVEARCIARARPLLAVVGDCHPNYGIEKVTWALMEDKVIFRERLSEATKGHKFDLSASEMLDKDLNTLFVNAAWITSQTKQTEKNKPWLVTIDFDAPRV